MTTNFEPASLSDIDALMTWFPDAASVDSWGGPRFRYPFDQKSFREDCRWQAFSSFRLRHDGELAAFGQLGSRYDRAHLARLVVDPQLRGRGLGRLLLEGLIGEARKQQRHKMVALFVYRDNTAALECYRALGFEIQDYPDDAPMRDLCYYLARPLD